MSAHGDDDAPLRDLTVIDLSRALAGPHATMMMGDLGARVIKVEAPEHGDDSRSWGPPFVGEPGGIESTYFLAANRNKESVALDLKSDVGRDTLAGLVRSADVLVENFRPGVLDRLGFPVARLYQLNPRLIVLSITGFGHDGPEGGLAGYDQIAQGEAGLMSLTGPSREDPQRVGVPIADLLAGMYGAYGVLAALHERAISGEGRVIRTSPLAAVVGVHAYQGPATTVAGQVGAAAGNHHPSIAPYGLFQCRDEAVQLACGNQGLWRRLCLQFGLDADDPAMASNAERVAHRALVQERLEKVFADHDAADVLTRLDHAGVPAGRVRSLDEVYRWDQVASQGLLVDVAHPTLGALTLPGPPLRFFGGSDSELHFPQHRPPPTLDQHGDIVRAEYSGGERTTPCP